MVGRAGGVVQGRSVYRLRSQVTRDKLTFQSKQSLATLALFSNPT
jgi:hypothetical protein